MKSKFMPFAVCCLLCALSFAQHWDIEQVDSAGWGAGVQMRWHPDGRLVLGYSDTSGAMIRLAWKDTVWHYDSIVAAPGYYGHSFSISRQGCLGVSWLSSPYPWQVILARNSGSSWEYDTTGLMVTGPGPALLAYDTAGSPTLVYSCTDGGSSSVVRARLIDSLWHTDRILAEGGWSSTLYCCEYLINSRDSGNLLYVFADAFPGRDSVRPWWYQDLYVATESLDTWVATLKAFGWNKLVGAEAMALDSLGAPQACWCDTLPIFKFEGTALDTQAYSSSVAIDRLNRPCVAYTRPDLVFTYRTGSQWRPVTVSLATTSASSISLAVDDDGQPLIAFSTGDGLWLAHGVDIVGQSDERQEPTARGVQPPASVIRDVLFLSAKGEGRMASGDLLDATGRNVLALKAGANDVRGLAPGIYFVRSAASGEQSAFRKVLVVR